jgi:6-phospho-3-hexuloisomerase
MTFLKTAMSELEQVLRAIDPASVTHACKMITQAGKIMVFGCGREGLQLRGFAMRLHHLGRAVAVQGDMNAPPLGPGDLFIACAGPGELPTVTALMQVAQTAGATILFITAVPGTASNALASYTVVVPAQTMANDRTGTSALPMGSLFEGALFLLFEAMIDELRQMLDESFTGMRARHTNME